MGLNALLVCLFEESEALEHLAFKLEQEQLVLVAGRPKLLARNSAEFEEAVKALATVSRRREELVVVAAAELGLAPSTTLSALADATTDADERRVLTERGQVMRAQVARINDLCARNREILARNLAATTDALALLGEGPSYTAGATTSPGTARPRMLDARA
ncbi:MAG TPA: flagellar export chaperone FlgN [Acidimicrobiales bacterium]|nr:flagellar export chaperone FlgN [Acidimicrobiales bacterium]